MKTNSTLTSIGSRGFLAGVALVLWSALPTLADTPLLTSTYNERNYSLVYNSQQDEYLAGLTQDGTPVVQRLLPNGSPSNSVAAPWMSPGYVGTGEIQLAYNPHLNQYFAVMVGVAPYPWPTGLMTPMIFGALLDGSANLVAMPVMLALGGTYSSYSPLPGFQDRNYRTINVAFNTLANEYLVTYQSAATRWVYSQRVSETGALLGSPYHIDAGVGTHAIAYAPVISPETPTGRYLFVFANLAAGRVIMLGSAGEEVAGAIPFDWGTMPSEEFCPDVVYANIPGHTPSQVFLVVWEDQNNVDFNHGADLTGVWGGYVDATKLNYRVGATNDYGAFFLSGSCFHNFVGWEPRIAYDPSTLMFHLTARQTPATDSGCPAAPNYHISLTSFSGTSLGSFRNLEPEGRPPVISQITGAHPGNELPRHPTLAVDGSGKFLVVWDDARNSGTGNQRDIYGTSVVNDECSGAIALSENVYFTQYTAGAGDDGFSTCLGRNRTKGVWFTYKPSISGVAKVDTCPSDFDTNLEVFTGGCGALTSIDCNENSSECTGYWQAALTFPCTAGTTYYLYAGGYNGQVGRLQIRVGAVGGLTLLSCSGTAAGDSYQRGFYVPQFPGVSLISARLEVSATVAGTYGLTLTVRSNTYDGPVLGVSSSTVTLSSDVNDNQPITFGFPASPVAKYSRVCFILSLASGPSPDVYYSVAGFTGGCPQVVQTEDTTPPLSTFRRYGVNLILKGMNDPNTDLRVAIASQPGGLYLHWNSIAGRTYTVQTSDNMQVFNALQTGIAATPPANTFGPIAPLPATQHFYRLVLEAPPPP